MSSHVAGARLYFPTNGKAFDKQIFDDTCLLTVVRWFRKRAGLLVPSQAQFVRNVIAWGRKANGVGPTAHASQNYEVYRYGGGGSRIKNTTIMLLSRGVDVKDPQLLGRTGLDVADMKLALQRGYDVVAAVKGQDYNHAVAVIQITNGQVVYGDPWNGLFWTADECAFNSSLIKEGTVFLKWQ